MFFSLPVSLSVKTKNKRHHTPSLPSLPKKDTNKSTRCSPHGRVRRPAAAATKSSRQRSAYATFRRKPFPSLIHSFFFLLKKSNTVSTSRRHDCTPKTFNLLLHSLSPSSGVPFVFPTGFSLLSRITESRDNHRQNECIFGVLVNNKSLPSTQQTTRDRHQPNRAGGKGHKKRAARRYICSLHTYEVYLSEKKK